MLMVNGVAVPASSRRSEALRAYNNRANVLGVTQSKTLRLVLPKVPAEPDKGFCSYCGNLKPLGQLVVWYRGEEAFFYGCKDKRRHCLRNLQKGIPPKRLRRRIG